MSNCGKVKDQIQQKRVLTSLRTPTGHLNREPLRVTYIFIEIIFFLKQKNLTEKFFCRAVETF